MQPLPTTLNCVKSPDDMGNLPFGEVKCLKRERLDLIKIGSQIINLKNTVMIIGENPAGSVVPLGLARWR